MGFALRIAEHFAEKVSRKTVDKERRGKKGSSVGKEKEPPTSVYNQQRRRLEEEKHYTVRKKRCTKGGKRVLAKANNVL